MLKISYAKKEDWNKIRAFLLKKLRADHILLDKKYFFWFYFKKIRGLKSGFLTAELENKVQACIGFRQIFYKIGNKKTKVCWITNWYANNKEFSVPGLVIFKKICETNKIIISIDNTISNLRIVKKLNWSTRPSLKRILFKF